jgi:hypothetical protein
MMFIPCHEQCVFAHAWTPATHCLTLILTTAGLLHLMGTSQTGAVWIVACLAVLIAALVRPLLNYYYEVWELDMEAVKKFLQGVKHEKRERMKRALSGCWQGKEEPLANAALDNIVLIEETAINDIAFSNHELPAPSHFDASFFETVGRLGVDASRFQDTFIEGDLQFENEGAPIPVKECLGVDSDSSKEDRTPSADCFPLGTHSSMKEIFVQSADPEVPTAAPVISAGYLFKGNIINALYAVLLTVLAFLTLTQFRTASTCGMFKESLCWALVLDFAVVQPLTMAFTGIYRWLAANDDEGQAPNAELHPFDGAIRHL